MKKVKHKWYHYIFPILFILMSFFIVYEGATPGNSSSAQSSFFASLFDFGKKEADVIEAIDMKVDVDDFIYVGEEKEIEVSFSPINTSDTRVHIIIDDESILTNDENKLKAIKEGKTNITIDYLANRSLSKELTVEVKKEEIKEVNISTSKKSLAIGQSERILIETNRDVESSEINYLYDSSIVSIDDYGYIHGLKIGESQIQVMIDQIKSNAIKIMVSDDNFIKPSDISIEDIDGYLGDEIKVKPEFNFGCEDTNFILKSDTLKTKDDMVYLNSIGSHTLTICSASQENVYKEIKVNVKEVKAKSITLNLSSIQYGVKQKLGYTLNSEVEEKNVSKPDVMFSSSNESIVSIDSDGYLFAYKKGRARIKVTWKEDENILTEAILTVTSLPSKTFDQINHLVRKIIGHFMLFFVTGVLGVVSIFLFFYDKKRYLLISVSLVYGLILAMLSEFLQIFVGQRGPSWNDVGIDFLGYFLGCLFTFVILFLKSKKKVVNDHLT